MPFLVFLISRGLASVAAWMEGLNPFSANTWIRWDSNHYLEIAEKGYEFFSCKAIDFTSPNDWCGNTGWFPGYPLLIRFLTFFTGDYVIAAVILPPLFLFLFLTVIWNGFLDSKINRDSLTVLAAAAVFSGSIYDHAAFPISMFSFLLVLVLWFLREKKLVLAGIAGFLGSITYPTGVLIALLPLFPSLFQWRTEGRIRTQVRNWIQFAVFPLAGFLAVMIQQWWETGVWGAFLKVQTKYGYTERLPMATLVEQFIGLFHALSSSSDRVDLFFIPLQTVCVALFMIFALVMGWRLRRELKDAVTRNLVLGAGLSYWLFPHLLGGSNSFYRSEAILLPTVLLLNFLPKGSRIPIVFAFGLIALFMSRLFFRSVLV